ncbi:hypothetical protein, partial [Rhodopirellula sp. UBA1907]|uniref:hypothetical protein n=1 Tax=Rhodopirellula sp. UBA1907 TaxID=1947381 RepID=UPI00257B3314
NFVSGEVQCAKTAQIPASTNCTPTRDQQDRSGRLGSNVFPCHNSIVAIRGAQTGGGPHLEAIVFSSIASTT